MLRLLERNRGLEEPKSDQEKIANASILGHNDYNPWRENNTAWLEAERKKAEAFMHRRVPI
jgi:hypothetical protein